MTDGTASAGAPAAWYPDPYGAPLNRWWDGSSWTDHTQGRVDETPYIPTAVERVEPSFLYDFDPGKPAGWYPHPTITGAQRWWNGYNWTEHIDGGDIEVYAAHSEVDLSGVSTSTRQIWAIVIMYAVIAFGLAGYVYAMFSNPALLLTQDAIFVASQAALTVIGFASWAAAIVLARSDEKELAARGLAQPFNWAFSFIPSYGPTIYIIGRSVVARRRTGHGIAPMWWHIATYAGGTLAQFAAAIVALAPFFDSY